MLNELDVSIENSSPAIVKQIKNKYYSERTIWNNCNRTMKNLNKKNSVSYSRACSTVGDPVLLSANRSL